MNWLLLLLCMITVCTGTFFSGSQSSSEATAYNLCVYSKDPSKYEPKCFVCSTNVYTSALQACVNGTSMPSNITYDGATCMEKNCAINYPKQTTAAPLDSSKILETLSKLFRMSRSVEHNSIEDSSMSYKSPGTIFKSNGFKIIREIETFASDSDRVIDIDYDSMT